MTKNKLTIKVNADTTEALQQLKEVTEAANECVVALEKLETVMGRFNSKSGLIESGVINLDVDGITESMILQRADAIKLDVSKINLR